MTFISYAQNFEDVMLWRCLSHIDRGFYIDIGAAWPDVDSVTKAFYLNGWRGINVEPNESLCIALRDQRPEDINLDCVVSDVVGTVRMNFLSNAGLSTADPEIAHGHIRNGNSVIEKDVLAVTMDHLWEEYVPDHVDVHFLKIDVEGFEYNVISSLDWKRHRPWLVVVEATLPMSQIESYTEWEPILLQSGYLMAYEDGLNRFYVAKEHANYIKKFRFPPNIWDDFICARLVELQDSERKLHGELTSMSKLSDEKKTELSDARLMNIAMQDRIDSLQVEMTEVKRSLNDMHLKNKAILESMSWKLTAPLRKMAATLNKLFSFYN